MPRRVAAAVIVVMLLFAGCGDDGPALEGMTDTSVATTLLGRDLAVFCGAMQNLAGSLHDAEALDATYWDVADNAPPEIDQEVSTFLTHARAVSDAFLAAGAPDREVDVEAVLASLGPEEQRFVADLVAGAETGELPEGSTGTVLRYVLENCS